MVVFHPPLPFWLSAALAKTAVAHDQGDASSVADTKASACCTDVAILAPTPSAGVVPIVPSFRCSNKKPPSFPPVISRTPSRIALENRENGRKLKAQSLFWG
ncbi:hypothetical protein XA68_17265 [Ophiocordyceps unilateralis]|uniref:Secreted protein n=1 Tax=Ophiocordyceps unilateralis TaxID=268505 RepID=A0A2A9PT23_OPHUN|nr:hypothetical protein XA68_17265 [Ophiocordyceps unilateralis]